VGVRLEHFLIVFSKPFDMELVNIVKVYFPEEKYREKSKIRKK